VEQGVSFALSLPNGALASLALRQAQGERYWVDPATEVRR